MGFAISRLTVIGLEMLLSPIFFSRRLGVHVQYRSIGLVRLCVYAVHCNLNRVFTLEYHSWSS